MADLGFSYARTRLAWQRTALSMAVGVIVVGRINLERSAFAAIAEVSVALPLCLLALILFARGGNGITRDGRPLAALAAVVVVLAMAEAAIPMFG